MYAGEIEPADISDTDFGWHFGYAFVEYWSEKIIQTNYQQLPFEGAWRDQPAAFVSDYHQYLMLRNRAVYHHSEQKRKRDANKLPEGF